MLQFFDETGLNPLPAGIAVSVYQTQVALVGPSQSLGNFGLYIGTAYTTAGGKVAIDVDTAISYIATFSASGQAPGVGATSSLPFVGFIGSSSDPTVVTVTGYRSPTLSVTGYAQAQVSNWPKLWMLKAASTPGGNAYGVAIMLGAIFNKADEFFELVHGAMRLQSCTGAQLDTWAYDFFGGNLP